MQNFCPFIQDECRRGCAFYSERPINCKVGWPHCILAAKISNLNDEQFDQLEEIRTKD